MANLAESLHKRSSSLSRRAARLSEDSLGGPCQPLDSIGPEPDIRPKVPPEDDSVTTPYPKTPRMQEMVCSSTQDETFGAESTESLETVRRNKVNKVSEPLSSLDTDQDDSSRISVPQNSPTNSIRLTASKAPGKRTVDIGEKENTCEVQPYKSLGRWGKIGHMAKGDGKGHSLRGFFR